MQPQTDARFDESTNDKEILRSMKNKMVSDIKGYVPWGNNSGAEVLENKTETLALPFLVDDTWAMT